MLDDLLELVLDVGGRAAVLPKEGGAGQARGPAVCPGRRPEAAEVRFSAWKGPVGVPGKKTTLGEMRIDMFDLDQLFQKSELIPVIIQHARDQGRADAGLYAIGRQWSGRSRQRLPGFGAGAGQKLWNKGETSGHFLHVEQIFTDCDTDTLLYFCLPDGPTCHTGRDSCFFQRDYVMITRSQCAETGAS